MPDSDTSEITTLLHRWGEGDRAAERRLFELLHAELRRVAGQLMLQEAEDHTFQPTELVNEAYLRLCPAAGSLHDRVHFLAVAARVMRHILIDHARARASQKRGGAGRQITLNEDVTPAASGEIELNVLSDALERLDAYDERKARFIEMRYLAGLTNDEIAEVAGVSSRTVKRELHFARAWLRRDIEEHNA